MENTSLSSTVQDTVAIAFICDDGYVMPTCVAITSLLCSKKPETIYDIHIVCASLSQESQQIFRQFESSTTKIHIITQSADRFADLHVFAEDSYCVATPAALLKFVLPELLQTYDKVLYLDGDLLVREDLTSLFHTELKDAYLAAVTDSGNMYLRSKYREQVQHYFNSGVMLLNLAQMRQDHLTDTLIRAKAEQKDSTLMDQNIFNCVCDGRTVRLPVRYNFLPINLLRTADQWTMPQLNELYGTVYANQRELFTDAAIIHFASKDKPWKDDSVAFADDWYRCYYRAPIAHPLVRSHRAPIQEGKPAISVILRNPASQESEAVHRQTLRNIEILQGTDSLRQAQGQYVIFADGLLFTDPAALAHCYETAVSNDLDILLFDDKNHRKDFFYPSVVSGQTLYAQLFRNQDFCMLPGTAMYRREYLLEQNIQLPEKNCRKEECFFTQALLFAQRVKALCYAPCQQLPVSGECNPYTDYICCYTSACFLLELLTDPSVREDTTHAAAIHVVQLLDLANDSFRQLPVLQQTAAKQETTPLDFRLLMPVLKLHTPHLFPSDQKVLAQYRSENHQLIVEKVARWEILQDLYREKGERWQELQALKKEKGQRYLELQALKKENAALQEKLRKTGIHRDGTIVIRLPSVFVKLISKIAAIFKKGA